MILNELSVQIQNFTQEDVLQKISDFIHICHKLFHEKGDKTFYYSEALLLEPFIESYTISDWLNDPRVQKNEKDFFRSLLNRGNLIHASDYLDNELLIKVDESKVKAVGCLVAYEWNSFVISLASHEIWTRDWIEGVYYSIHEEEKEVTVRNCNSYEQISKIEYEENQKNKLLISSGQELWEKRKELFPHLVFCDSVKKQLEEARVSLQIQNLMKRIQVLEDYFATYQGKFEKDKLGYRCRYESDSVQNDKDLKELRKFKTPNGKSEYFYWHISFPGNYPGRIHFIPDKENLVGVIGYVGKHLPTKKYRTI